MKIVTQQDRADAWAATQTHLKLDLIANLIDVIDLLPDEPDEAAAQRAQLRAEAMRSVQSIDSAQFLDQIHDLGARVFALYNAAKSGG